MGQASIIADLLIPGKEIRGLLNILQIIVQRGGLPV